MDARRDPVGDTIRFLFQWIVARTNLELALQRMLLRFTFCTFGIAMAVRAAGAFAL